MVSVWSPLLNIAAVRVHTDVMTHASRSQEQRVLYAAIGMRDDDISSSRKAQNSVHSFRASQQQKAD
jgi:hypothetical protein